MDSANSLTWDVRSVNVYQEQKEVVVNCSEQFYWIAMMIDGNLFPFTWVIMYCAGIHISVYVLKRAGGGGGRKDKQVWHLGRHNKWEDFAVILLAHFLIKGAGWSGPVEGQAFENILLDKEYICIQGPSTPCEGHTRRRVWVVALMGLLLHLRLRDTDDVIRAIK